MLDVLAQANGIGAYPLRGLTTRFLMIEVLLLWIPFSVEVIRTSAVKSSSEISSSFRIEGRTKLTVDWSSSMASPSIERPDFG